MKPSSNLIRRLEQVGCLTSEEANYIECLQHSSEKNYELLNIAKSLSFKKHFVFIESLHLYGQVQVATVLERGGVVIKVKATCVGTSVNDEFTKRLNTNISTFQLQKIEEIECKKLFDAEIPRELEILEVRQLRRRERKVYIVIWLWCKSHKSLRQLSKLAKSGELLVRLDILIEWLWSRSLDSLKERLEQKTRVPRFLKTLIVDTMQFQREVAVRQLSTMFCGEFKLPPNSEALTSLDDKIYILTEDGLSIHHYEAPCANHSHIFFPPPELSTVSPAYNFDRRCFIDACNQTKCVYIAKGFDWRVWKLTTPDHNLKVWMHYVGNLCSLSVGSNGNVLIIKLERRAQDTRTEHCLEIYSKDAVLAYHISLDFSFVIDNVPCSTLEISPGKFAFLFQYGLLVQSVNFATHTVIPNSAQYLRQWWLPKTISAIALYSTSRIIALSWKQLSIFDSQLNLEFSNNNFYAGPLHYRKDKRQVLVWSPERGSVQIYTLQYEGEDLFADNVSSIYEYLR